MTPISLLLFLRIGCCIAAVLFDRNDFDDFSLLIPTNISSLYAQWYLPPGVIEFSATGQPNVSDVASTFGGRFTAISAPVRRIDRMPVAVGNETITIDVDYRFSLREPAMRSSEAGHGLGQYLLLSSDEDAGQDPRGLVFEYGGGSPVPPDGTSSNWSEPRVAAWRYDTVKENGLGGWPTQWTPTALRARLIRQGTFRVLARFEVQRNTSTGVGQMSFIESRVSVENNANFSGILVHYVSRMTQWQIANASRWLERNSSDPPRLVLFASRTDFLVENLLVTAERKSLAPSFNSSWLASPPPPTTNVPTPASTTRLLSSASTSLIPTSASSSTVMGSSTTSSASTTSTTVVDLLTLPIAVTTTRAVTTASEPPLTRSSASLSSTPSLQMDTNTSSSTVTSTTLDRLADDGRLDQTIVIGLVAGGIVALTILVIALVCAVQQRQCRQKNKDASKHTKARVLNISGDEMHSARADQSSVRVDNIYGPAPVAPLDQEYEIVDARAFVDTSAIYTAAPAYDRFSGNVQMHLYDSTTSPLV